jgi:hypothetical protein
MTDDDAFTEYRSWDRLAAQCDMIDGLSTVERERAKRAFLALGAVLGADFLELAIRERHPILQELVNLAPWTRHRFTWLAEALAILQNANGFGDVLRRLRHPTQFAEAMSLVRSAATLQAVGFSVEFEPRIQGFAKVPDLRLIHQRTGERLYVEITTLKASDIAKDAERTSFGIASQVLFAAPFLHFAGRIHRSLSERHLADVVERVRIKVVQGKDGFQELVIPDVVNMALAPDNDRGLLEAWASEHGLEVGSFSGPPFGVDEVQRVRSRIRGEQKQLPTDAANILVIEGFNATLDGRPIATIVSDIAEALYDAAHVFAAVVSGGYMGSGVSEATMHGQHCYIRRRKFDVIVEEHLILINRFSDAPVSPAVLSDLYRAYLQ